MNVLLRTILVSLLAVGSSSVSALLVAAQAAEPDSGGSAKADFKRDIQPLLEKRCLECHGPQKQKSGLRLDRKSSAFKGGDSGKPALVAGKSADSLLIQKITSRDPEEMMPPKGERLTAVQVALLKNWIDAGAIWPEKAEKAHWAYVKPERPPLPKVKNKKWPRNPIDFFVLERLEQEKLQPSPEADRATLIRRLSLDLIGLPPTPQEVDDFRKDKDSNANEKIVDRLLSSPHYGERWARPWLDLARYADTQGYEKDNRRTMWPYRDWVIKALNRNMPFNQFTIEQIAGDMLPDATQDQHVATGFHRNTMTNTEGGTDNEEFRYEALVDRINTTFSVWLATTFACAQCHNHKYDPFTTLEYYRVMAFLNNTEDADYDDERPTMKVFKSGQREKLTTLRDTQKATEQKLNDAMAKPEFAQALAAWEKKVSPQQIGWEILDPTEFKSEGGATLSKTESKSILADGKNPDNDTYVVTAPIGAGRFTGIRLEALETGQEKALGRHTNGGFVLRKFDLAVKPDGAAETKPAAWKSVSADFSEKKFDVTNILTGKGDGWAVAAYEPKNKVRRSAYFTLTEPLDLPQGGTLTFTLRHSDKHPGANLRRFRLYATHSENVGAPAQLPDDVRTIFATAPDKRDDKQRARLNEYYASVFPETKPLHEAFTEAKKVADDFEKTIPITSVMVELDKPRETRRHIRGGYLSTAEVVTPGVPEVLQPLKTPASRLSREPATADARGNAGGSAESPGASTASETPAVPNRLDFARWLQDENNPLTARVTMNRFWEQYFGIGIVETSQDFGTQSEPPSHPKLLDWLATEFMRVGWDMKAVHKLIVMSATYRQSSRATPELLARDPNNRLLARGPHVRLEAEMIRDQALAVSGLLSPKIGGPSVMPPQPDGLWMVVYSGDKWETSKGDDKYRRGLYTFWRRSMPHPAMTTFDAPSREYCVVKRTRSNTPLQALVLLNDPAYIEAAQALARRMMTEGGVTAEERIKYGIRVCLSRQAKPAEVSRLAALYEQELTRFKQDNAAAEKMATSEVGKPPTNCDVAELAAWTILANVLLNLDEMVTKG